MKIMYTPHISFCGIQNNEDNNNPKKYSRNKYHTSLSSKEELAKQKSIVSQLNIDNHNDIIKQFYGIGNERKTYNKIAEEQGVTSLIIRRRINGAILKSQIEEGTVPKPIQDVIDEFKEKILKGVVPDEEIDEIANNIYTSRTELLSYPVEKMKQNVEEIVRRFEKDGMTKDNYIKGSTKHIQLLCQSPDTIEKNIRGIVKRFEKEGLTASEYIKTLTRQPSIFYQSPDTIEKNIRGVVKRFENEGLTTEEYLKIAIKMPPLFSMRPETIERNIRGAVKVLEKDGFTTSEYLQLLALKPSLFCLKPENIDRKIRIRKYKRACEAYTKDKNIQDIKDDKSQMLYSAMEAEKFLFLCLLNTLVFSSLDTTKISNQNLRKGMPAFLRNNPDKTYNLKVLDGEFALEFIKFAKLYSQEILGKNVFKFEIIKNPQQ